MDKRGPGREVELHLTGNMERYTWSFDGVEFGKSTPVRFRHGERLRVILHNDTMMTHPMHLHGLWERTRGAGRLLPGAPAHHSGPAGAAHQLSRHRRRARPLGLALPPDDAYGRRHVPRSGGGMMALQFRKNLIVAALFSGLGTSTALAQHDAMQGGSAPADARDPHAYSDGYQLRRRPVRAGRASLLAHGGRARLRLGADRPARMGARQRQHVPPPTRLRRGSAAPTTGS